MFLHQLSDQGVMFLHQLSDQDSDFSVFLINPTIAENQSRDTIFDPNSLFFASATFLSLSCGLLRVLRAAFRD